MPATAPLQRDAGVHERQRRAADGGHRRRAVGLQDVRHDADRVGELLGRRDHRDQRALGERPVTDVAALRAAEATCLAHREGREVVVVEVELLRLEPEGVQPHLLLQRAEGGDAERLRLATREERGAVRARCVGHLDVDRADLVLRAAVRALLVDRDALAHGRLLEGVERLLDAAALLRVALPGLVARVGLDDGGLDGLRRVLTLELVLDLRRRVERCAVRGADGLEQALVDLRRLEDDLLLAGLLGQLALCGAELPDRVVGDVEGVEHLGLGDLGRARLDHEDRVLGAGDDQVELGRVEEVLLARVDDEVALDLADAHRADGRGDRDVGDHERGGRAVHGQDVVRVDVIDRHRDGHELRVVPPALGEQRPDRPVDHSGGQDALLPCTTLALEEGAGDLAGCVHPLLDIHRQREEVDFAQAAARCGGEDHGVALADDDGTRGLLCDLPRLERDLGTRDLDRDGRRVGAAHRGEFPSRALVGRRAVSLS